MRHHGRHLPLIRRHIIPDTFPMSSLSFVTPNPLISLHTEQSACLFIRPAVSPHTLLHMIRRHSASHHFLSLRIPLYFPRTRYRILREKRKKDAVSAILQANEKAWRTYEKTNSQTKSNTQRGTRAKCDQTDFPSVSRKRKG